MYGFTAGNQTASNLTKEVFAQDSDKENDNHHVALKQDYNAYGQAKRSMLEETPQFNGEMLSSGNLTYMRARNYDSTIGQFTSKDTWLGRQTNPLSQNRNTFVENNPVNYIDPSGHWPDWGGMWNSVSNAAQNTWNAAVETTKAVVNTVVHVAQEIAQAVVQTVQNVVSTVTNVVSNIWNTVNQGARAVWNTTKQWGNNVKNYTQQKIEHARQYVEYMKREAVRKYEQAKQAVSQVVNKARDMGIQLVFKSGMTLQQQLEYTKKIIQICSNKKKAIAEDSKRQDLYDEKGKYGGDQMLAFSEWTDGNEEKKSEIRKMVQKAFENSNMSDIEISKFLYNLREEGCSYVASTNAIFNYYRENPNLFKERFGIDYYDRNGKLNTTEFLIDFYQKENDKKQAAWWEFWNWGKEVYSPSNGVESEQEDSNIETYLKNHNVKEVDMKQIEISDVQKSLDSGNSVVINAYTGSIIDINGKKQTLGGGHAMIVTGVNSDGSYTVSTWGRKARVYPKGSYDVREVKINDK